MKYTFPLIILIAVAVVIASSAAGSTNPAGKFAASTSSSSGEDSCPNGEDSVKVCGGQEICDCGSSMLGQYRYPENGECPSKCTKRTVDSSETCIIARSLASAVCPFPEKCTWNGRDYYKYLTEVNCCTATNIVQCVEKPSPVGGELGFGF